ncbi:hypothetical protein PCASD_07727 [Puccinia coronata f. sp. avenae]|uniref:Uncharacterized protein n=1 Tax=Puccinia coronata f. sp. avenae TaxID=200324 RepID=A0A2N5UWX6_9BASI|nr:hypothetical protein PCASD_07727 [Puccinia coronata f. sp. avenae]
MAYNHYNISPLGHMNGMHPPPGEIPTGAGRGPRNLSTGYSGSTNQGQSFHQAVPDPQEPHGQDPQTNGQPALQGQTALGQRDPHANAKPAGTWHQFNGGFRPQLAADQESARPSRGIGPDCLLLTPRPEISHPYQLVPHHLHRQGRASPESHPERDIGTEQSPRLLLGSQELIMNTDQPDSYGHLDSYGTEAGLRFAQRKLGISDTTYNKFKVLFKLKPEEQLPIIAMMIHDHHSSPKTVAAVAQAAKPEISTLKSAKNHAYPSNFKVVLLSPDIEQYGRTIPGRRHISQNPVFKIQRLINSQGKPFWHANLPAGYNKKKSEALTSVLLEIWKTVKNEKGYFLKLVGFL